MKRDLHCVALGAAGLALCGLGLYHSVRLALADSAFRSNSLQSVAVAVRLDPCNSRYWAWLAELQEFEGKDSEASLETAARLNPLDSRVWIRRGLNAELAGRVEEAERCLLHAAEIDRLMEPRWSLMNFYFRQGREAEFWKWARQTFTMSYGDRSALFELCQRMTADARKIAAEALPAQYPVLREFVVFLERKQQYLEAAIVGRGIAGRAPAQDRWIFVDCVNRLIAAGEARAARDLWLAMGEPDVMVTNGDFRQFPTSNGFDWRVPAVDGVSAVRISEGLRLTFNGRQPESCELLWQPVVLPPGQYRLRISSRWHGTNGGKSGVQLVAGVAALAGLDSADWETREFTISGGADRVVLLYERPKGEIRGEGAFELGHVTLARSGASGPN